MASMNGELDSGSKIDGGTDLTSIGNVSDQLKTIDFLNTSIVFKALSVTTTATLVIVGGSVLANRKSVTIMPTNGTVYLGYSSAVTTSSGMPVFKNQQISISAGSTVTVYLIGAGTVDVRIMEGS